jgi:acetylornithine deacetylase/succinyl-diaminopimelate desuccinylase-like protein
MPRSDGVPRAADESKLRNWIDDRADEMARLLIRLVACETENPPGRGLAECAELLRGELDRPGLAAEVLEPPPAAGLAEPRIVRGTAGDGQSLLYFHGHFDVVPVQDRAQFAARRHDGVITGRGTADMKGGIVSMLYAAAGAQELGLLGRGRIVLNLVCDEETGSTVGSGYLRQHDLIERGALAMLTAEQSGEAIWHAAKGALTLRVQVHGRASHVGRAHQGVNSFLHMVEVARPLAAYARELSERHTACPVGAGEAPGSMVVVGGKSGGGSGFNVVPGQSYFTVDGRFNPEEDIGVERDRITAIINDATQAAGASVSIEVLQAAPAAATALTDPAARLLGGCVAEVSGAPARYQLCPGCLDTRWYSQLGIPAFGLGPGRFDVSHGPDEYVAEAALRRVAAVYGLFATRLLAG